MRRPSHASELAVDGETANRLKDSLRRLKETETGTFAAHYLPKGPNTSYLRANGTDDSIDDGDQILRCGRRRRRTPFGLGFNGGQGKEMRFPSGPIGGVFLSFEE